MTLSLPDDVIALLDAADTVKILATVDADGTPHAVEKQSLHAADDGTIHYLERLESSATNRNLVRAIWFDATVAIALRGSDGRTVQIKGRPVKAHITGPLFQSHYVRLREREGDADLAAVWVIEPTLVADQDLARRRAAEEAAHPTFIHLDRIAKI
jgi:predicted pyridoxine 5'-phosphate oxidase superfamily flavin-nucleotide-binding protein